MQCAVTHRAQNRACLSNQDKLHLHQLIGSGQPSTLSHTIVKSPAGLKEKTGQTGTYFLNLRSFLSLQQEKGKERTGSSHTPSLLSFSHAWIANSLFSSWLPLPPLHLIQLCIPPPCLTTSVAMATTDAENRHLYRKCLWWVLISGVGGHWKRPPPESSNACPFVAAQLRLVSIVASILAKRRGGVLHALL